MSDFDAVVVGGGISGLMCAYLLAKKGKSVAVFERGTEIGEKNISGGRIYMHSFRGIEGLEDMEDALERVVSTEQLSFLDETGSVNIQSTQSINDDFYLRSYTILMSKFLSYLARKCEELGVMIACGVRVDSLVVSCVGKEIDSRDLNRPLSNEERVIGIKSGEDVVSAECVILAEGVNSLLAQSICLQASAKGKNGINGGNFALGIKEVISLNVDERFGEGKASLFVGSSSDFGAGGGFLYVNRDTVSLGCVLSLEHFPKRSSVEIFEDFKNHPYISSLIKGGKSVEYSAHLIPEGGFKSLSALGANGVLVIGDAAGFCINLGYTVRGMDLAVMSARAASDAILSGEKDLVLSYKNFLEKSEGFIDMKKFSNTAQLLDNPRFFDLYPKAINSFMRNVFEIGPVSIKNKIFALIKQLGIIATLKDLYKGGKIL